MIEDPQETGSDDDGTPRWVKVFAAVAAVIVVLFVVLILTGRGAEHGPGRHALPDDDSPTTQTGDKPPPGPHRQP